MRPQLTTVRGLGVFTNSVRCCECQEWSRKGIGIALSDWLHLEAMLCNMRLNSLAVTTFQVHHPPQIS